MTRFYKTLNQPSSKLVSFQRRTKSSTIDKSKPIVLSIEGNIGSGKSTLINILKDKIGSEFVEVMAEPVSKWTNCRGANLLGAFYSDPQRYAYTFQSFAFVTRMMAQQVEQHKAIRILERSSLSDHCFAKNCYENGLMNDVEWAAYQEWWYFFANTLKGSPEGIIYLRTTPDICHSRVHIRNRSEESTVSKDYLHQLHKHHEDWLPSASDHHHHHPSVVGVDSIHSLPFVILNEGDFEFEKCDHTQNTMVDKVYELIHYIQSSKS